MNEEKVKIEEVIEILKRIKACLNYDDWINAKEYIDIEIKKLSK